MESQKLCAYNQTRECFLGLDIVSVDLLYAELKNRIATFAFKSGAGLWMAPFRGIPTTEILTPFDLVYLDENCRVIDVVESFPTFSVNPSSPRAASALALPTHSIFSSQTQSDDQLVICAAGEMERRLEVFSNPGGAVGAVQSAVLLRKDPLWSGGPGLVELEDRSQKEHSDSKRKHEMNLIEPGMKNFKVPKSWLERWWSPDPRKAPRNPAPGLAAYYWTGSAPKAHSVKDISTAGLYLVTEERWYPGTLVLMTLQKEDGEEEGDERSISVYSRAVRCGEDGVGLQFVLSYTGDPRMGTDMLVDKVDKKDLDRFLQRLRKSKG
jgi:hypothetical protein